MRELFIKWFINIVALLVVVHTIGGVHADNWQATVVAALVIGFLNSFLRPIFILFTLPLNILSLGFLTLIINAFMFYVAAQFVKGFTIVSFWSAFWAALLFSIISFALNISLQPNTTVKFHRYGNSHSHRITNDDIIDVEGEDEDA